MNRHISLRNRWILGITFVLGLGISGCGKEKSTAPTTPPTDLITQGWEEFERGSYQSAYDLFRRAVNADPNLSDAYNGLGWSAGHIEGKIGEAREHFSRAFSLDSLHYDALGGWTFALYQTEEYSSAIERGGQLLNRKPRWRFLHNPTLDFNDIRLIQAFSWVHLGNFEEAYRVVRNYLNPDFDTDISSPSGKRELLDELERLRSIYG